MKKHSHGFVIPVILLIVAYEWVIASVDKLMTKNYIGSFHKQLSDGISDVQWQWYAHLVKSVGLPMSNVLAVLVLAAELFVGISFLVIAIRKLQGANKKGMYVCGLITSIIGAFMNMNYAILGGDTLFVDPANAFQESISIDWILCLVEVTLAVQSYSLMKKTQEVTEKEEDTQKI